MHRTLVLVTALTALASPAFAAVPDSPTQIVGRLYAPYLANPHAESGGDDKSAMELIRPYASKAFGAAIDKDQACMVREQGVCNVDWDVIINGQDWELSNFALEDGDNLVRARFVNDQANILTYRFVKEGDAWKIDDIETEIPSDDGSPPGSMSIKTVLNQ